MYRPLTFVLGLIVVLQNPPVWRHSALSIVSVPIATAGYKQWVTMVTVAWGSLGQSGQSSLHSAKMEEQDSQKVDKRFEYLGNYVLKTFQLKSDIWQKCLAKEEQRQTIQDFLDKSDHTTLVVTLNSSGQLFPSFGFVETQKNRTIYFSKRSNKTLSVNTIKTDLIYGDIVHSPLVYFSEVVNEVSSVTIWFLPRIILLSRIISLKRSIRFIACVCECKLFFLRWGVYVVEIMNSGTFDTIFVSQKR